MHATHLRMNKIFDFHPLSISVTHLHLSVLKYFQNHKYQMYLLLRELLFVHTVLERQITLLLKHQTNLKYTKYTFIDFHIRSHTTALLNDYKMYVPLNYMSLATWHFNHFNSPQEHLKFAVLIYKPYNIVLNWTALLCLESYSSKCHRKIWRL